MSTFCMDAIIQVILHCLHNPSCDKCALPDPLCHCLSLEEADGFCRHGSFNLVLVPSRPTDHQECTRTICAESLKYRATFVVPCFTQDSSKKYLRVVWAQQRFRLFNVHLQTFTFFQVLLRLCSDRSVSRAPHLVFHFENFALVWEASFFYSTSETLSLVVLQNHISFCVTVQE